MSNQFIPPANGLTQTEAILLLKHFDLINPMAIEYIRDIIGNDYDRDLLGTVLTTSRTFKQMFIDHEITGLCNNGISISITKQNELQELQAIFE